MPEDMADISSYVKSHPKVERMFLSVRSRGEISMEKVRR